VGKKTYLTYCAGPYAKGILNETRLTIFDTEWFRS
jgi:hypothetical protein